MRLHYQFAKLHLNSHVFRGLSAGQPIPHYFLDCTTAAICAATSTIDFILSDLNVADVVVGIPSYLHCMTAFACMFLVKVALKYGRDLIDPDYVWDLTTRLVQHFRSVPAGRWHLSKLIAPGLERVAGMLATVRREQMQQAALHFELQPSTGAVISDAQSEGASSFMHLDGDPSFDYNMMSFGFGLSPLFPLDLGVGMDEQYGRLQ